MSHKTRTELLLTEKKTMMTVKPSAVFAMVSFMMHQATMAQTPPPGSIVAIKFKDSGSFMRATTEDLSSLKASAYYDPTSLLFQWKVKYNPYGMVFENQYNQRVLKATTEECFLGQINVNGRGAAFDVDNDRLFKVNKNVCCAVTVAEGSDLEVPQSVNSSESACTNDASQIEFLHPAPTSTKSVFVTAETYLPGDIGGLTGADEICQLAASDAGISGNFKAWLSDSTASPATRFTRSTQPYQLPDGRVIATDWVDLTSGRIANNINGINVNQFGEVGWNLQFGAWTGTHADGTAKNESYSFCQDWTYSGDDEPAAMGVLNYGNLRGGWTEGPTWGCSDAKSLYCFEQ